MIRVMLSSGGVLAVLLSIAVTCAHGRVTGDANAIAEESDQDANGLPLLMSSLSTRAPSETTTAKIPEERTIDRQVKEVTKMRCKPRREKVYTRDYLKGDQQDLRVIFPEVLSVKRCDVKCTYCNQKTKAGWIEEKLCLPTKQKEKKYVVRGYKSGEKFYFKVSIPIHQRCKCMAPET